MSDGHRLALVTGAADPGGIGAACARALAARGCAVGLLDRRPCDEVVASLRAAAAEAEAGAGAPTAPGPAAASALVDLAEPATIAPAVDALEAELGAPTSILVNCAADLTRGPLPELDAVTLARVLAVNVTASVLLAQRVAPGMAAAGSGRIVNIASDTFDRPPGPGMTSYIASKGAVIGLTRSLALELGESGITVNAISPGLTWTAGARGGQPPEHFERVRGGQAVKRTLAPDDYAGVLGLLVSPEGAAITGQTIRVDGGLVMM